MLRARCNYTVSLFSRATSEIYQMSEQLIAMHLIRSSDSFFTEYDENNGDQFTSRWERA